MLGIMSSLKPDGQGADPLRKEEKSRAETSELLLRACHDLRSPVRAVCAHAELLLKDREPNQSADVEQRVGFIVEGARKIERLADGLSSYAIALAIDERAFRQTRMDAALRRALAKVDQDVRESGAVVTYDMLPCVTGDPDRLSEVFENLVRNAVLYRDENSPRVHVTAERRGESWLFAVRDNGPGVPAAYVERMFKAFERLSGKQTTAPGLGLTISREIVERHKGRIWAESSPGAGTTVFFTVPAGEPDRDQATVP